MRAGEARRRHPGLRREEGFFRFLFTALKGRFSTSTAGGGCATRVSLRAGLRRKEAEFPGFLFTALKGRSSTEHSRGRLCHKGMDARDFTQGTGPSRCSAGDLMLAHARRQRSRSLTRLHPVTRKSRVSGTPAAARQGSPRRFGMARRRGESVTGGTSVEGGMVF
jgi:hypothetical protein